MRSSSKNEATPLVPKLKLNEFLASKDISVEGKRGDNRNLEAARMKKEIYDELKADLTVFIEGKFRDIEAAIQASIYQQ